MPSSCIVINSFPHFLANLLLLRIQPAYLKGKFQCNFNCLKYKDRTMFWHKPPKIVKRSQLKSQHNGSKQFNLIALPWLLKVSSNQQSWLKQNVLGVY